MKKLMYVLLLATSGCLFAGDSSEEAKETSEVTVLHLLQRVRRAQAEGDLDSYSKHVKAARWTAYIHIQQFIDARLSTFEEEDKIRSLRATNPAYFESTPVVVPRGVYLTGETGLAIKKSALE